VRRDAPPPRGDRVECQQRDEKSAAQVAAAPRFGAYTSMTSRTIPVVALVRDATGAR
jgi:hypothetical protein